MHVVDLAQAHLLAMRHLTGGGASRAYNLGNGTPFSVREVLASVERVTGTPVPHTIGPRRPGDPAVLYASVDRIRRELGWSPKHSDLDAIVDSAWQWRRRHPDGYAGPARSQGAGDRTGS